MSAARRRLVVAALVLVACAWALAEALTTAEIGFLYMLPAFVMALPLALGRYVGERRIAALATRFARPRRRRATARAVTRSRPRVMRRGGRLVGSSLAKRPPPLAAPFSV